MRNRKIGFILKIFFVIVFVFGLRSSVSAFDTISSGGKVGYKLYNGETFATSSYSIVNSSGKDVYLGGTVEEFNSFVLMPPAGVAITMATPTATSILSVSPNPINIGSSTTWSWTIVLFATRYEANCIDPAFGTWSGWNSLNDGANLLSTSGVSATTGTWQCMVRGCNNKGCGPQSNTASLIVNPVAPGAISGLVISPALTSIAPNSIQPITFSWNAVTGATKYQHSCDNWTNVGEVVSTSVNAGSVPPATYNCSFRACNGAVCGVETSMNNIVVKSSAPSGFTKSPASVTTADSIIYSWNVVPGATSYQASVNGGAYSVLGATCNTTTCSLSGGTATAGAYVINLKACNSGAVCGELSSISFSVTQFTPSAPTGLYYSPSAPNSTQAITFGWSAVSGATKYQYSCNSFTSSVDTTGTSWYIGVVSTAGTYTCGVKACSGTSCSAPTYKSITVVSACVPSCTCAATTCSGSTCSNGCGGTCPGTKTCCAPGTYTSWSTNCATFCASKACSSATLWYNTYTNNLCTLGKSANTSLAGGNFTISAGACVNVPPYAKAYSCVCN